MRLNRPDSKYVSITKFVNQREVGPKFALGFQDKLHHKIYSSLTTSGCWDHSKASSIKSGNTVHGGVFNLEYSPDGSILIAACEQKSFIVLDPTTRKDVHHVQNAHLDCVNCVRFLDSRTFATCSDDTTVALWDVRNLKQKMRSLRGHSNWVKNIEYVPSDGLLVTSGFDGCVNTWDINSYPEHGLLCQKVFNSNGLMRMRLTPDCSKMILCTAGGYIMIVHNLDFSTLNQDLAGFKPNMYRLMQISQTPISLATNFTHLFTAKRNRIELISDWPEGDDAEVVSALQIHPYGWCVLSRNTSNSDKSEWTCVHDIQDVSVSPPAPVVLRKRPRLDDDVAPEVEPPSETVSNPAFSSSSSSSSDQSDDEINMSIPTSTSAQSRGPQVQVRITAPLLWGARPGEGAGFHLRLGPSEENNDNEPTDNLEVRIPSEEVLEALESIRQARSAAEDVRVPQFALRHRLTSSHRYRTRSRASETDASMAASGEGSSRSSRSVLLADQREHTERQRTSALEEDWDDADHSAVTTAHFVRAVADLAARSIHLLDPFRLRSRHGVRRPPPSLTNRGDLDMSIYVNRSRITHFIEEPNVGRGYIKELCFSPDGRVIASPYGNDVRLLTFNPQCADMCYSLSQSSILGQGAEKEPASSLHPLTVNTGHHTDVVVTTKFSPTHPVFVSGCLDGKIVWHQPVL